MRRFATIHPVYGRGLFLSRANIDVLLAVDPTLFLLNSSYKTEQVLMTGAVYLLNYNGQSTVYFPETLPSAPIALMQQGEYPGEIDLPWRESSVKLGVVNKDLWRRSDYFEAASFNSYVTFTNTSSLAQYAYFMVLAKEIAT